MTRDQIIFIRGLHGNDDSKLYEVLCDDAHKFLVYDENLVWDDDHELLIITNKTGNVIKANQTFTKFISYGEILILSYIASAELKGKLFMGAPEYWGG
jgi:hypothetical protein